MKRGKMWQIYSRDSRRDLDGICQKAALSSGFSPFTSRRFHPYATRIDKLDAA